MFRNKQDAEGTMARRLEAARQPGETSAIGRLLTWRQRRLIIAFLFVLPALINFAIFRYIPIVEAFRASLYQYSLLGGYGDFVGLQHYHAHADRPGLLALAAGDRAVRAL